MNIDIHNHCIPMSFLQHLRSGGQIEGATWSKDSSGREWVEFSGRVLVPIREPTSDMDVRLEQMDRAEIDIAVVSFIAGAFSQSIEPKAAVDGCQRANEAMAELVHSHPDRFIAMATVPLQAPVEAAKELQRCARDLAMPAVQIPAVANGETLDAPEFLPLFEVAEALNILVFVHPIHVATEGPLKRYHLLNLIGNPLDTTIAAAAIIFGGVLDRFPRLKFCFAHGGGTVPYLRGRWEHGYEVRAETKASAKFPPSEYIPRLFFDSLTHFPPALSYLVHTVGSDHVLIGTDYPADMGDINQVSVIRRIDSISDEEKANVLGNNAIRLLSIDRGKYRQ